MSKIVPHTETPSPSGEVCQTVYTIATIMGTIAPDPQGYRVMAEEALVIRLVEHHVSARTARQAIGWALKRDVLRRLSGLNEPLVFRDTITLRQIANGEYEHYLGKRPTSATNSDDSAWVLISKLQPPRIVNLTERRRYIERHPDIRTRRPITKNGTPHPKKLEVYIGDWVKHWDVMDRQGFDSLDRGEHTPITPDELTEDFVDGAASRYADLLKHKKAKK